MLRKTSTLILLCIIESEFAINIVMSSACVQFIIQRNTHAY